MHAKEENTGYHQRITLRFIVNFLVTGATGGILFSMC